ncbi:uncharacterized protein LOC133359611 isoform X2 [Lethenteron reissneri]|uniref:uncharacterized protein LOC133359611 isoform X2 n=1 Tax=Lethenteron reissneri TaxID=7753 RepID=UPI002AB64479|nr:uncharacterized protein LOC133359611 isoform X2 [Lethenteron reissneri]
MDLKSRGVSRLLILTRFLLLLPALIVTSAHAAALNEGCARGFFTTRSGLCCTLCPAGTYKASDCASDGRPALCEICSQGTFTDRPHNETRCSECRRCGPDEEVAVNCSVGQDAVCRCKEGSVRDPHSWLCTSEGPNPSSANALTDNVVIILVCTVVAFGVVIATLAALAWHWRKLMNSRSGREEGTRLIVNISETQEGDDAIAPLQVMNDHWDELKEWVGVNPIPLLDYLSNNRTITRRVHSVAMNKGGEECVEFLLNHFINEREEEHLKLWNALYAVRKNYLQIWRMLQENGNAVQAISKSRPQLIAWIGTNPRHLLLQLINQSLIPRDTLAKVRVAQSDEQVAGILLDFYVGRGNDDCEKLLFALYAVKNEYPEVKQWLNSLRFFKRLLTKFPRFLATTKDNGLHNQIRFNKAKICEAIMHDLERLLSYLEKRNYFSKTVTAEIRDMEKRKGRKSAVTHLIELVLGKGRGKSRQFLEILWQLQAQYPKMTRIFDEM